MVEKMGNHRNRIEITRDILALLPARKTAVMYKAYLSYGMLTRYLSYGMLTRYLNLLTEEGLITSQREKFQVYSLTDEGRALLPRLTALMEETHNLEKEVEAVGATSPFLLHLHGGVDCASPTNDFSTRLKFHVKKKLYDPTRVG